MTRAWTSTCPPHRITKLTGNALADLNLTTRMVEKTKNFFALGLMYWLYNRELDQSIRFIREKFGAKDPDCGGSKPPGPESGI